MEDLHWYFHTRRAVEQDNVPTISTQLIQRFHAVRRRFAGAVFESLYADWTVRGDDVLRGFVTPDRAPFSSGGQWLTHELPFSYSQFGNRPGVA